MNQEIIIGQRSRNIKKILEDVENKRSKMGSNDEVGYTKYIADANECDVLIEKRNGNVRERNISRKVNSDF